MDELTILKEACMNVRKEVKNLLGSKESREKFGIGAGGDISRKIDLVAENTVFDTLKKHGLKCKVIAEEAGIIDLSSDSLNNYVILDAIDGTANAMRGLPFCCCSIALAEGRRISDVKYGAVIDLFNGDLYTAYKDHGAYLNDKKIQISDDPSYLIGMNLSGAKPECVDRLKAIMLKSNHLRHLGSNALELCVFARGLLDAFIDLRGKIRITDMAAAYLIAKEAGGIIISDEGRELDTELDINARISFIAAANKNILSEIARDTGITLKI